MTPHQVKRIKRTPQEKAARVQTQTNTYYVAEHNGIKAYGIKYAYEAGIAMLSVENIQWESSKNLTPDLISERKYWLKDRMVKVNNPGFISTYKFLDRIPKQEQFLSRVIFDVKNNVQWKNITRKKVPDYIFTSNKDKQYEFSVQKSYVRKSDNGQSYKVISNPGRSVANKRSREAFDDLKSGILTVDTIRLRLDIKTNKQVETYAKRAGMILDDYQNHIYSTEEYELIKKVVLNIRNKHVTISYKNNIP